ncbi:fibrobacter succinogenes major paralogous domain-containing protein [Geojedonia litorea]|uniref:Fibrobacter succinogenes major paralogous domain-containing protein n=1 Tax=Geojedonia litorea TaxID=1268269 RepID=A0ABV9MXE3_9FLAO
MLKYSFLFPFLVCTLALSQTIETVNIGDQVWMAKNLESNSFQNGSAIIQAQDREQWQNLTEAAQPVWAYYYYDKATGEPYGYMYNIYAITNGNPCPKGFRVPTNDDWQKLIKYVSEDLAAKKLKSISGWDDNGNGTNDYAFNALPGGVKSGYGGFNSYKKQASFWSNSTHDDQGLWSVVLMWWSDKAIINPSGKKGGLHCRCIKE